MKKIIRNISRNTVNTNYNGKPVHIGPKGTLTINDDATGEHLFEHLLQTYGFLRDATPSPKIKPLSIKRAIGDKKL